MRRLLSVRGVALAAASMICLGAALIAQDGESPNSLGDLARQTRAQHAAAPEDKSSKTQSLVDEMQQEQESAENAPTGFRNYNAGEYRLFVPYPYSLEGRENGGAVLAGSRVGVTNTEVMAGAPVPFQEAPNDRDLLNAARQIASLHGQPANCFALKQSSRKTYLCHWQFSPTLLGHQVWGSMEVIVGSNSLIPVMCVSPDDVHQPCVVYDNWGHNTCSDRDRQLYGWDHRKAQAAADATYRDERTTAQVCDQIIYPSIQLTEDIVVHPASISDGHATRAVPRVGPTPAQSAPEEAPGPSLAALARQAKQAPHSQARATLDNAEGKSLAPAGFQSFVLQYCQGQQPCREASVIIPEKAEVVSRTNGQHIFKAALDGEAVMLYAGPADVGAPYRSLTDPDYIRMRDLANSNGWSREKPDAVSTQELTIDGRPALMTRFRFQRDQKRWWIGERALMEDQGAQFLLGCAAPEQHFADAEGLCTTLVNSLRLP
ncbi:MAG TPA: hypothetical protein VIX37_18870 [Candidatus Sulfotelmatobacter sp.]